VKLSHLGEDGQPCADHAVNEDALLVWAAIGSRVSSFNHDIASKLQGLMMALDEIGEIVERGDNGDLVRATETANGALKEASAMLSANRQLTRTSTKTKAALRDIAKQAGERAGVGVLGDGGDAQIETVVPLLVQGLAVAIDAIAGTGRNRVIDVIGSVDAGRAKLVFASSAEPAKTIGEALAVATFVVARAGGELRCGKGRFAVELPVV
jgi:hypothetical protein